MTLRHLRPLAFSLLGTLSLAAEPAVTPARPQVSAPAPAPEADRQAILGMAGAFDVSFNFEEVFALQPDYEEAKPYQESARELVKVLVDEPRRIVLQHLLVVGKPDAPKVIKHWGQIWTYEDPLILDFQSHDEWKTQKLPEVQGTWTQQVTQTNDMPRYEGSGRWRHSGGTSEWVSQETRRPLPRRDHTKRDDYDVLLVQNRHLVTPDGWLHLQINRKRIERKGAQRDLTLEIGHNQYHRIDPTSLASAEDWWKENGPFWNKVRQAWRALEQEHPHLDLLTLSQGKTLNATLRELEKNHLENPNSLRSQDIQTTLQGFLKAPSTPPNPKTLTHN